MTPEAPAVTEQPAGAPAAPGRAGRNLPAAVAVGVCLGALVAVPLFAYRPVYIGVVSVAVAIGAAEVMRALRVARVRVPVPPLLVGTLAVVWLAWLRGAEGLAVGLGLTLAVATLWRLAGPARGLLQDLSATVLTAVYVPCLAGFAALLAVPDDGARRVVTFVATTVCSDVGGYATGVLIGRHPMAPSISPKKSWEGFAGSVLACIVGGAVLFLTLLSAPVWQGVLFGLAVAVTATLGDLGESMLKRDIGIKDMGALLPGHGGVMDRLDSLLVVAPVAWLLLTAFVPWP